jgi:hypothetical protein
MKDWVPTVSPIKEGNKWICLKSRSSRNNESLAWDTELGMQNSCFFLIQCKYLCICKYLCTYSIAFWQGCQTKTNFCLKKWICIKSRSSRNNELLAWDTELGKQNEGLGSNSIPYKRRKQMNLPQKKLFKEQWIIGMRRRAWYAPTPIQSIPLLSKLLQFSLLHCLLARLSNQNQFLFFF